MGYMGMALELAIDQFAEDQDDGFDEYVERIEADLIATTEKALTLVQWMDKEVPTGHVCNGKTTESTDALINVFVNMLEVDYVANVLQALIASPAGAAVRKAIAEAHASVNAPLIAEARVK